MCLGRRKFSSQTKRKALAHRVPGALSSRQCSILPRVASGVPEIDGSLGGGLPVEVITEVIGSSCSGRTSFALAFVAEVTCAGQTTAWIGVADALDRESAAAAGVDLRRQLWIRCGSDSKQPEGGQAQPSDVPGLLCGEPRKHSPSGGGGSPHLRNEVRGMPVLRNGITLRRLRPRMPIVSQSDNAAPKVFYLLGVRYFVRRIHGPWRPSGQWWTPDVWSREEWDVKAEADTNGDDSALLCLFIHDLLRREWLIEALHG